MNRVLFDKIPSYDYADVKAFIKRGFNEVSVFEKISKHSLILLKPNLLTVSDRTSHITTHPMIAEAVIEVLREKTDTEIVISDGSAGMYSDMTEIFRKAGYKALSEKYSIRLYNMNTSEYTVKNGIKLTELLKRDPYIINLAKLKTHMLTKLTLSAKNLYGLIPGRIKLFYHSQYPDPASFSEFVARLYQTVNPHLNIIDGIIGMEGNGPSNGDEVSTGIIALAENGFALDHFIADYTGFSADEIPFLSYAKKKGYYSGFYDAESDPGKFPIKRAGSNKFTMPLKLAKNVFVKHFSNSYPQIDTEKCRRCMKCVKICGSGAIKLKDGFPFVRRKKCITCYCCTEVCPYDAIDVSKSIVERLINAK